MFGMLPFEWTNDRFFDTPDNSQRRDRREPENGPAAFRTDIRDAGDHFLLECELPGFRKEDIHLELKDGILTIAAQHDESEEERSRKGRYIRRERQYGVFSRSFDVSGIDENGISAAYRDGILELTLPKARPVVPEAKHIAID